MSSKSERLREFLARLSREPAASSAREAIELVNRVIDAVEDELSGIPFNPAAALQLEVDGRMYGPHPQFASRWKQRDDVTRFAHVKHETLIQSNGAILIWTRRPRRVLLSKPGADGQEIEP
jgi:hypothetical protein